MLEKRFLLTRQDPLAWFKDHLKKSCIGFCVALLVLEAVYFCLSELQETWWLWATGVWFLVSVILARIMPKVILPLFFKSVPLQAGGLRERLLAFLSQYKLRLKDIFVLDFSKKTVKANAMVAGLGRTKQIFLSDTLLRDFPPEEIEIILAHEMGHYLKKDVFKLVIAGLASAFLSFFLASLVLDRLYGVFHLAAISDIAGLPLLLSVLMGFGFILLPFQNFVSRRIEKAADRFALEATGNRGAFISMMRRLGEKNLAEFSPSKIVKFFLYDHPPISERIAMAQSWKEGHELA